MPFWIPLPGGLLVSAWFGLGCLLAFSCLTRALAADYPATNRVALAWEASPGPVVSTFVVYYAALDGSPTNRIEVGAQTGYILTGLAHGRTYVFAATSVGVDGLESDFSDWIEYTIPLPGPPPVVALASPAPASIYSAPVTIGLTATVVPNGHIIEKVQFVANGTVVGEDVTVPYATVWRDAGAGAYSLVARVIYDRSSAVSSSQVGLTVRSIPPAITLTAPLTAMPFSNVPLSATVVANGHFILKVQFMDGATVIREDSTAPYSCIWSNVSAGIHGLRARVIYDAGNSATSATKSVSVANPPPVVSISSPTGGSSFNQPVRVSVAASVVPNGNPIQKVQFFQENTLLGEDSASPYVCTWTNATAGNRTLSAKVVYGAGLVATSAPVVVSVRSIPPVVSIAAIAGPEGFAAPGSMDLAATVTANGHAILKVLFFNGATLLGEDATPPFRYPWSGVVAGAYSVRARLVYDAGNTVTSYPVDVVVTNPPIRIVSLGEALDTPGWSWSTGSSAGWVGRVTGLGVLDEAVPGAVDPGQTAWMETSVEGPGTLSFLWTLAPSPSPQNLRLYVDGVEALRLASPVDWQRVDVPINAGGHFLRWSYLNQGSSPVGPGQAGVDQVALAGVSPTASSPVDPGPVSEGDEVVLVASVAGTPPMQYQWQRDGVDLPGDSRVIGVNTGTLRISPAQLQDTANYRLRVSNPWGVATSLPVVLSVLALPSPWELGAVGEPLGGTAGFIGSDAYVRGGGFLGPMADRFRFLHQPLGGDAMLQCRLLAESGSAPSAAAGLMVRAGLEPGAAFAFIGVVPGAGFQCITRAAFGATSTIETLGPAAMPDAWLRIVRSAGLVYADYSSDGSTWSRRDLGSLTLGTAPRLGWAVVTGEVEVLQSARFGDVVMGP